MNCNTNSIDKCLETVRNIIKHSGAEDFSVFLTGPVDWQGVFDSARTHNLVPMVYRGIFQNGALSRGISNNFFAQVQDGYYCTLARNMYISNSLKNIYSSFDKLGIDIMFFKGLMLAQAVYNDLGARPMADIDVLIKKKDLLKIDEVFREFGYRSRVNIKQVLSYPLSSQRNSVVYEHSNRNAVHWHLYWHIVNFLPYRVSIASRIDMDEVWGDAVFFELDGAPLKTFSFVHQVLYLCLHGAHHAFYPSVLLYDIASLIRSQPGDIAWEEVAGCAVRWGLDRYVHHGLYLAREVFGAPVPGGILSRLAPKRLSSAENIFISSVIEGRNVFGSSEVLALNMNDTFLERLSFLKALFFPKRHEMSLIKQKSLGDVRARDYLDRFISANRYLARLRKNA